MHRTKTAADAANRRVFEEADASRARRLLTELQPRQSAPGKVQLSAVAGQTDPASRAPQHGDAPSVGARVAGLKAMIALTVQDLLPLIDAASALGVLAGALR